MSDPSNAIGKRINGIDHKKRSVVGKIIGVDPRPQWRMVDGPYFVVLPDDPQHDPSSHKALTFVRCADNPQVMEQTSL